MLLACDLKYLNNTVYNKLIGLCDEIGKMLNGLQRSLK
ncbi:MAG: hypothetical protein J7L54_06175 [Elusimicrobia bacterium]|nr:hypothetical protein [Elusimicrobiota bacterium]